MNETHFLEQTRRFPHLLFIALHLLPSDILNYLKMLYI